MPRAQVHLELMVSPVYQERADSMVRMVRTAVRYATPQTLAYCRKALFLTFCALSHDFLYRILQYMAHMQRVLVVEVEVSAVKVPKRHIVKERTATRSMNHMGMVPKAGMIGVLISPTMLEGIHL
jgi:hypothetical protein